MTDDRLDNLDKVLSKDINTFPTAKCSLKDCQKPYYQKHLRERYCSDNCRIISQRLSNKKSKKKKRSKSKGKIRLIEKIIDFV